MKKVNFITIFFCTLLLSVSCGTEDDNDYENPSTESEAVEQNSESKSDKNVGDDRKECEYDDGSHNATVDYYNPNTGHRNTYDLDVEVRDCKVVQIDFPNGGWLDESHFSAAKIDENGNAQITDDRGYEYDIDLN